MNTTRPAPARAAIERLPRGAGIRPKAGRHRIGLALTLTLFGLAPAARAETLRCVFTDPFHRTSYDFATRTLTVIGPDPDLPVVRRRLTLARRAPGQVTLLDGRGLVVQQIALTWRGSDGMSDLVYPYEVRWQREGTVLVGACTSDALPAKGQP